MRRPMLYAAFALLTAATVAACTYAVRANSPWVLLAGYALLNAAADCLNRATDEVCRLRNRTGLRRAGDLGPR